jgi:hypothetical protein
MENIWDELYPNNLRLWILEKNQTYAGSMIFKYGKKTFCSYVGFDRELCLKYTVIRYLHWKEIKIAETEEDRKNLIESGFSFVEQLEGKRYYRKRKRPGKTTKRQLQLRESGFLFKLFLINFSYPLNCVRLVWAFVVSDPNYPSETQRHATPIL